MRAKKAQEIQLVTTRNMWLVQTNKYTLKRKKKRYKFGVRLVRKMYVVTSFVMAF